MQQNRSAIAYNVDPWTRCRSFVVAVEKFGSLPAMTCQRDLTNFESAAFLNRVTSPAWGPGHQKTKGLNYPSKIDLACMAFTLHPWWHRCLDIGTMFGVLPNICCQPCRQRNCNVANVCVNLVHATMLCLSLRHPHHTEILWLGDGKYEVIKCQQTQHYHGQS